MAFFFLNPRNPLDPKYNLLYAVSHAVYGPVPVVEIPPCDVI